MVDKIGSENQQLDDPFKKELGPLMLWALGVGYVISGMYFGWNLGLPEGGSYGFLAATAIVTVMYACFVASYGELCCALPRAGGAFVYAHEAFGANVGVLSGMAQWIEFVFAPPAIAAAIGAYSAIFFPQVPAMGVSIAAYAVFTALNCYGVKQSAIFELIITVLAVAELLLFVGVSGLAGPGFRWQMFSLNPLPHGWMGLLGALPYAIWFYLGIEGLANVAEDSANPQRDLPRALNHTMATLAVLAVLTLFTAVGVAGWEAVVYAPGTHEASDSPLPLALAHVVGQKNSLYHLLVTVGLFGLIASFHGILLAAGRVTFEFGRVGYAPRILGRTLKGVGTPAFALVFNMVIGCGALLTGRTADIIQLAVFGALTLYVTSMGALFRLRATSPSLPRPYRVPCYPLVPAVALGLATLCLVSMAIASPRIVSVFMLLLALGFAYFRLFVPASVRSAPLRNGAP